MSGIDGNWADEEGREYMDAHPFPEPPTLADVLPDDSAPIRRGRCHFWREDEKCDRGVFLDEHTYSKDSGWICPSGDS